MKLSIKKAYKTSLLETNLQEAAVDVSQLEPGTKVVLERGTMPGFKVTIMGPGGEYLAEVEAEEPRGQKCGGAFIVSNSNAVKGYGPLAYDIAMEYAGKRGLTADRNSVSSDASKVWEFYFTRRSDVKKQPLQQGDCSFDSSKSQGAISSLDAGEKIVRPWLNYVYYMQGNNKLTALRNNNMLEMNI